MVPIHVRLQVGCNVSILNVADPLAHAMCALLRLRVAESLGLGIALVVAA